ncbi:MAG: hypothetical protein JOZ91_08885 [Candidatus Eremiobacteraeota bacterium]|nr:hypothetical protein [Candidatus Eremiobacteraeota bacterium]MBV8338705.1 hypothetical protein [Candidatus Eremiobacteraeota bacterium]MBV8594663.1 hypothetical protein [Candidatus Eremiobacteraeota bacterium]MBV8669917.1 hypothetical protein [Candidatus Eremiobacteraeota bacterium]MBV8670924.1 hypothetical protein [Candidatus Eremiobacteraeota bacterium]
MKLVLEVKEIHVYSRPTIIATLDASVVLADALGKHWDGGGSGCDHDDCVH